MNYLRGTLACVMMWGLVAIALLYPGVFLLTYIVYSSILATIVTFYLFSEGFGECDTYED